MKKLVVCGDSFAKGIGCRNLETEPYGSLVANSLGLELVNIAKGSSTNYSIFAQVLYAIENIDDIDMILVTSTSYDRVEWFKHNENPTKHQKEYLTNYDINYHEYPPYMPTSYSEKIEGEQHIMSKDLYNGNVFTENLLGIIDYFDNVVDKGIDTPDGYYKRFNDEPKRRTRILYDYAQQIHDPRINKMHSLGAMAMCHIALKNANIKHLIGTDPIDSCKNFVFINDNNHIDLSWAGLALKYPDDLPSLHTSAKGHRVAAKTALRRIYELDKKNGW